jgi:hypothetical protein
MPQMEPTAPTELATELNFDADCYLAANRDVAAVVASGGSAIEHFRSFGRAEGRRQAVRAPRSYRMIFSIGSQCLTSVSLKNAGLKRASGPFDWIYSSLGMVADCIEDDFRAFLDPDQYVPVPDEHRPDPASAFADHRLYARTHGVLWMFNHADPTRPEVAAYLARCVDRWRRAMGGAERTLALGVIERHRFRGEDFDRICDGLDRTAAGEALVLLVRPPEPRRSVSLLATRGRHRLFELVTTSPVDGIAFADPADNAFLGRELLRRAVLDDLAG